MPKNRIPRRRDGSRRLNVVTNDERLILAALYRRPDGAALEVLSQVTGLSSSRTTTALDDLSDGRRCAPLGAQAVERVMPGLEDEPAVRYRVTEAWKASHRTGLEARQAA